MCMLTNQDSCRVFVCVFVCVCVLLVGGVFQHISSHVVLHVILQIRTQRALNDYSKPLYPLYKDKLTRLKYIGGVTADRLRDVQVHIPGVPFTSVETGMNLDGIECGMWGVGCGVH